MQFSDLCKSPKSPLSRLRHQPPQPLHPSSNVWDPDLFSRDKEKQKNAVRRYLEKKVRSDWEFPWPPPPKTAAHNENAEPAAELGAQPEGTRAGATVPAAENNPTPDPASHSSHDAPGPESRDLGCEGADDQESDYSTVSDDPSRFRPRTEWESGEETDDDEISYASSPLRLHSPFRFDSPDSVGNDIVARTLQKQTERRRELRAEMKWNDGLACFQARRDAWTGAKVARLKPAAPIQSREEKPLSPLSPRRLFMRAGSSIPSALAAGSGGMAPLSLHGSQSSDDSADGEPVFSIRETTSKDTNTSSTDENDASTAASAAALGAKHKARKRYPVVTLVPNPQPILPPDNPMRASITPGTYNSIFEKIVLQSMTPSCPVNLADIVNVCVAGWKRRGEWPPRLAAAEPNFAKRKANNSNIKRQQHQQGVSGAGMVPVTQPSGPSRSPGNLAATTSTAPAVQPPSTSAAPSSLPLPKSETRRKSFSFLTREKSKDKDRDDGPKEEDGVKAGKAFRRSLQRVLGWNPSHVRSGSLGELAASPTVAGGGKTDPAPAVINPETARGGTSLREGAPTCGCAIANAMLDGEHMGFGSNWPSGERAEVAATASVATGRG